MKKQTIALGGLAAFVILIFLLFATLTLVRRFSKQDINQTNNSTDTSSDQGRSGTSIALSCDDHYINLQAQYGEDYDACFRNAALNSTCQLPEGFADAYGDLLNIEIVLDSSGSKAELISGKSKIDIAKETIKEFATVIPERAQLGLRVYGSKGDEQGGAGCTDTTLVYPISTLNTGTLNNAIGSFQPTGWTPIGLALSKVADDFATLSSDPEKTVSNVIFLVTDGEETCGGNPVKQAKLLNEANINAVINVVGLNVDNQTAVQLKNIASAGKGEYFDARTEEDFRNFFVDRVKLWEELNQYKECVLAEAKDNKELQKDMADSVYQCLKDSADSERESISDSLEELVAQEKIDSQCKSDLFLKASQKRQDIYQFGADYRSTEYISSSEELKSIYFDTNEELLDIYKQY